MFDGKHIYSSYFTSFHHAHKHFIMKNNYLNRRLEKLPGKADREVCGEKEKKFLNFSSSPFDFLRNVI